MTTHAWDGYIETHDKPAAACVAVAKVDADRLRRTETAVLMKLGVPHEDAVTVADVFMQADLRGEESHGARLLLNVLGRIDAGGDDPNSPVTVVRDHGAVAVWDAGRGIGQVVAARAMRRAIEKASSHGIGVVGVRNANSYTSAKYYALLAAKAGMIGMTCANGGMPLVVPEGGSTPVVGTNPIALAAPAKSKPCFVLDMAVSVAMEKIFQAHERGTAIPLGWGIDSAGLDTTDPAAVMKSRALLPIAGPKGFGLGFAHEILTCVLMGGDLFGGAATGFIPYDGPMNVSQYFQAINIDWFMPLEEFKEKMDEALAAVGRSKPRAGVERIYYPGERGFAEEEIRLAEGIPLRRKVLDALNAWCGRTGIPALAAL